MAKTKIPRLISKRQLKKDVEPADEMTTEVCLTVQRRPKSRFPGDRDPEVLARVIPHDWYRLANHLAKTAKPLKEEVE